METLALHGNLSPEDVERIAEAVADRLRPDDEWLDVEGAAAYLKCRRQRMYDLSSESRIPVHREGIRLLFSRRELDDWIKSGRAA
jgi:excisionase family DNA binding protein